MREKLQDSEGTSHPVPGRRVRTLKDAARLVSNTPDLVLASAATNVLSLAMPVVILQIYDRVIPNNSTSTLAFFILGLGCVLMLDAAFSIGRSYVTGWSAARLQHILGVATIERLLGAELRIVEGVAPGVLLQRMRAVDTLKAFYAGSAMLAAVDLPFIVLFLTVMGLIGHELALIPLAVLIATAVVAVMTGRTLRRALEERAIRDERRQNFVVEVLSKIPTVKALGLEALLCRRYERLQASSAEMSFWVTFHSSIARSIGGLFSQITMAAVAAYGSTMVIDGRLSVGSLAACTFLAGRSAQPMLRAFGLWTQFQSIAIASKNVTALLDMAQEQSAAIKQPPAALQGGFEARGVAFGYGDDSKGLFHDVNFVIRPGETIAITGPNGSGKTTLMHLMSGLLTPTLGQILLDGKVPRDYDLADLRTQICHIPQAGTLFQGTILENLTSFGDGLSVDGAVEVAELLGLTSVISRLPKGFDTKVGEGANDVLPSGIRQLICMVRAISKTPSPRIILFDEANSQFDRDTDDKLVKLLEAYRGRATMVIVSHRPSYLKLAQRLYVFGGGTLEETSIERYLARTTAKPAAQPGMAA